jgi:hypothetical protein
MPNNKAKGQKLDESKINPSKKALARRNAILDKVDAADGKTSRPALRGPYKMHPGKHSEVNPGNFRGSEVQKYAAFSMHPMKFEDQKGTGPGITQADVVKARKDGYDPKMYPKAQHPMNFRNQLGKAVGLAKKADKAYRAEGDKNDPDYQNMMSPKKYNK